MFARKSLKNRLLVPADHTYGLVEARGESVADQLIECTPCPRKKPVLAAIAQLNRVRVCLRKKDIDFDQVQAVVRSFDAAGQLELPKESVYLLLCKQYIQIDPQKLEPLLKFVGIVDEASGLMKYVDFIDMLDIHKPYPILDKLQDVPAEHLHYDSTYASLLADAEKPFIPNPKRCLDVHPCDRNDVAALIAPNECIRNGLYSDDYTCGRSQDVIRAIFQTSGLYRMTDAEFADAWTECVTRDVQRGYDEPGLVCAETFKNYLDGV